MSSAEWGQPSTQAWQVPLFSLPRLSIRPLLPFCQSGPGGSGSEEVMDFCSSLHVGLGGFSGGEGGIRGPVVFSR